MKKLFHVLREVRFYFLRGLWIALVLAIAACGLKRNLELPGAKNKNGTQTASGGSGSLNGDVVLSPAPAPTPAPAPAAIPGGS